MSRIEQLISDIESYIDTCKYYPLSNVKIIVNKEQLEDMLTELRLKTPDEVKLPSIRASCPCCSFGAV